MANECMRCLVSQEIKKVSAVNVILIRLSSLANIRTQVRLRILSSGDTRGLIAKMETYRITLDRSLAFPFEPSEHSHEPADLLYVEFFMSYTRRHTEGCLTQYHSHARYQNYFLCQ